MAYILTNTYKNELYDFSHQKEQSNENEEEVERGKKTKQKCIHFREVNSISREMKPEKQVKSR